MITSPLRSAKHGPRRAASTIMTTGGAISGAAAGPRRRPPETPCSGGRRRRALTPDARRSRVGRWRMPSCRRADERATGSAVRSSSRIDTSGRHSCPRQCRWARPSGSEGAALEIAQALQATAQPFGPAAVPATGEAGASRRGTGAQARPPSAAQARVHGVSGPFCAPPGTGMLADARRVRAQAEPADPTGLASSRAATASASISMTPIARISCSPRS